MGDLMTPMDAAWSLLKADPDFRLYSHSGRNMHKPPISSHAMHPAIAGHLQRTIAPDNPALARQVFSDYNEAGAKWHEEGGWKAPRRQGPPVQLETHGNMTPMSLRGTTDGLSHSRFGYRGEEPGVSATSDRMEEMFRQRKRGGPAMFMGNPDNIQMVPGNIMQQM